MLSAKKVRAVLDATLSVRRTAAAFGTSEEMVRAALGQPDGRGRRPLSETMTLEEAQAITLARAGATSHEAARQLVPVGGRILPYGTFRRHLAVAKKMLEFQALSQQQKKK